MSAKRKAETASIAGREKRAYMIAAVFSSTALLALTAAMAAPQYGLIILLGAAFIAMSGVTLALAGRLGADFATIRVRERENVLNYLQTRAGDAPRHGDYE